MTIQCIIDFSLFGLEGLTPGPKLTKLGGGLQQVPLPQPAKFQSDCTNGLQDLRYQSFSLFDREEENDKYQCQLIFGLVLVKL